jgi:hypothetical protein
MGQNVNDMRVNRGRQNGNKKSGKMSGCKNVELLVLSVETPYECFENQDSRRNRRILVL